jgi:hypothetical protein
VEQEEHIAAMALAALKVTAQRARGYCGPENAASGKCNLGSMERNGTSGVLILTTTRRLLRSTADAVV